MRKVNKARTRKERITVSLSPEAAELLRDLRVRVHSPSMSALIENLVSDLRGRTELEELEAKMKAHYDGMSETDREEEAAWGALGESALASLETIERFRSIKRQR